MPPESVTLTVTLPTACAGVRTVNLVVPVVMWAVVPGVPPKSTASVVATRLVPVMVTKVLPVVLPLAGVMFEIVGVPGTS